jgi:hypothetical protein
MDDRQLEVINKISRFAGQRNFEKFYKVGSRNGRKVYVREFSARKLSDESLTQIARDHRPGVCHKITERDRRVARLMLSCPKVSWLSQLIGYALFAAFVGLLAYISCGPYRFSR